MNLAHRLLVLFLLLCTIPLFGQSILIPFGSEWKYYDKGNQPPVLSGQAWYQPPFNDNQWVTGQAQLGYGDGDEATELDSDATTVYFRKKITLNNVASYGSSLSVDFRYDDGAIIYLNGAEVKRVNMPSGTTGYNSFSIEQHVDNSSVSFSIPNNLVNGINVIAVSMHQKSSESSDLSFDLKMQSGNTSGGTNSGGTNITTNTEIITRGPYLQNTTSESVVIKWLTTNANRSIVRYGTNPNNLDKIAFNNTETKNHELSITGLAPNTKYYYALPFGYATNVNLNSGLYFRTHPQQGDARSLRAWVLGDCGSKDSHQRDVRNAFYDFNNAAELDMILLLGDNAYGGAEESDYQAALFEDMYEEILKNTGAWSCFGNHDSDNASSNSQSGTYYDIFTFPKNGEAGGLASGTEAYYSFDYGNIHFIVLDSEGSDKDTDAPMYEWCENDIQNTLADWIVALWHHPPYSKGSHDSDDDSDLIEMRENFVPMLEDNGVDLILSGHSHSYERSLLLNGHYGKSYTFDINDHTVGSRGDGDGRKDGDGAYEKQVTGSTAGDGAVYVVAGSSGKSSDGDLDHEAMFVSLREYGSCLLEVDGQELNLQFINDDGDVDDYFTLRKNINTTTSGGNGGGTTITPDCTSIVATGEDDGVLIGGLGAAPVEVINVRDASWNLKYSCNANCNEPTTFVPLTPGTYHVSVKRYTATNGWICEYESTVQVSNSSSSGACDINVSVDGDDINISGFNAANRIMQVFDSGWNDVVYCLNDCDSYTKINNLADDEYYVRLLGFDENWMVICEFLDYVTIGNGSNLQGNEHEPNIFLSANKNNPTSVGTGTVTQLNWVTNSDFQNEYFEVERSANGIHFEVIQKVMSQSDITDYFSYESQDTDPIEGLNVYRVKQVYYNGGFRYSNSLHIDFSKPNKPNNKVYPNPAKDLVYLDLAEFAGVMATISIVNGLGQEVYRQKVASIPELPMSVSLSGFSAGPYLVTVDIAQGRRWTYPLVLVRD